MQLQSYATLAFFWTSDVPVESVTVGLGSPFPGVGVLWPAWPSLGPGSWVLDPGRGGWVGGRVQLALGLGSRPSQQPPAPRAGPQSGPRLPVSFTSSYNITFLRSCRNAASRNPFNTSTSATPSAMRLSLP